MSQELPAWAGRLLECYIPEARYLTRFKMVDGIGHARLRVQSPHYCKCPGLEHLTMAELQLCINQMVYCYFAATGALATFDDYTLYSVSQLAEWQARKTFIIEQGLRFHRPIPVTGSFSGTLQMRKFRRTPGIYVADVDFDFARGACVGSLRAAAVP